MSINLKTKSTIENRKQIYKRSTMPKVVFENTNKIHEPNKP